MESAALVARRCMEAQETGIADLSNCSLIEVPQALYLFLKSTVVTKIDLSGNLLKRIPSKLFKEFPNLEEGNFSKNKTLTKFPEEILMLEKLTSLNLSENQFDHVPRLNSTLKILDLSKNLLESLSIDAAEALSKLDTVDISENNFNEESKKILSNYPQIKT